MPRGSRGSAKTLCVPPTRLAPGAEGLKGERLIQWSRFNHRLQSPIIGYSCQCGAACRRGLPRSSHGWRGRRDEVRMAKHFYSFLTVTAGVAGVMTDGRQVRMASRVARRRLGKRAIRREAFGGLGLLHRFRCKRGKRPRPAMRRRPPGRREATREKRPSRRPGGCAGVQAMRRPRSAGRVGGAGPSIAAPAVRPSTEMRVRPLSDAAPAKRRRVVSAAARPRSLQRRERSCRASGAALRLRI